MMQLLFLHGPPACGKLTIAKEVAAACSWPLFHNHLTVDLVASLFEFGSEPFVQLRESIWLDAFASCAERGQSLIFTFNPEATVTPGFPQRVQSLVEGEGGKIRFVELVCAEEEIERRIESASRAEFGKLRSLEQYRSLREAGAFDYPSLPSPQLRLDTATLSAAESAARVLGLLKPSPTP